jgi:hypothetical protein
VRPFFAMALLVAPLGVVLGCASTTVKKNPGPHDHGVRYYLPKPYLLVTTSHVDKKAGDVTTREFHKNKVDIVLEMRPDFSEEYSIHARAGVGINKTEIELEDGWMLKSVNFKVDSNTTENINAISSLLGNLGPLKKTAAEGTREPVEVARGVEAHNVPLGYYESVIEPDGCGKKRIYGWRYVGFLPYSACPTDLTGAQCKPCTDGEIYGLVYEHGVMAFKRLDLLAGEPVKPKPQADKK